MTDSPTILAVVVTFNRLGLLRRLVARLAEVPELSGVIVVDNASTDGTREWLATQDVAPATGHPLTALALQHNVGGAGGFNAGITAAMTAGADLVWLMDDDGLPEPDCLARLLEHGTNEGADFWGPLVVDEARPDQLVFPIRLPGRATVVRDVAGATAAARGGVIDGVVIPFNGVLVTRELVERIGNVRSEFFIWGDDHEYRLRAERAGARVATVVAARVHHPAVGALGSPMLFGRSTYNDSPRTRQGDLKHYCMARNNLLNLRTYRGNLAAAAFVAKTAWFYTVTRPSLARLRLSVRAMRDGLRGDFTGHERFLA